MNQPSQVEVLGRLAAKTLSVAEAALALGHTEARTLELLEVYLLTRDTAAAERARFGKKVTRVAVALCAIAVGVTGWWISPAFAQSCSQTLPAPLVTFCPGAPAQAANFNTNFQQLVTWLTQKAGPLGVPDITTSGAISGGSVTTAGAVSAGSVTTGGAVSAGSVSTGTISASGSLTFTGAGRQTITMQASDYGYGLQNLTNYARTGADFAWYRGGTHTNAQGDPGTGGTRLMSLNSAGVLGIGYHVNYCNNAQTCLCNAGTVPIGGGVDCDTKGQAVYWSIPSGTGWYGLCHTTANATPLGVHVICARLGP